ncbi:bifunctional TFIIS-LEDGF domain superfamily/Zinc finger [Babesia duncani]|uniref:Bifunctional TFIIS-LEDGF domain superfamily/Zinc finger n=1 Tax=Babesia duncani TaxID=323732 RepID=A0AAD9PMG6_9APIC|nr:bifunctional TFIIS-LEDGF domain superfamily/Zinc finger [Babesia duncani]
MLEIISGVKSRIEDFILQIQQGILDQKKANLVLHDLEELDKHKVDREILATTRIGIVITKLCKIAATQFPDIASRGKDIIKKWKDSVKKEYEISAKRRKVESESNESGGDACIAYKGKYHDDEIRDKALNYLFKSFMTGKDFDVDVEVVSEIVFEIELELYKLHILKKQSQKDYNQQLKSIAFNLKDLKNTGFNSKIYKRQYTGADLACMQSTDMASDEKKSEREVILQESLQACQSDWAVKNIFLSKDNKAKGQFRCFKCKSQETVYQQLQTRSSDEPMTTFVTCLKCNNRWKF